MGELYGDRSRTRTLLERLRDPKTNADDLHDLSDELGRAEDPRAVAPLRALLEDRRVTKELREAAACALFSYELDQSEPSLLSWWRSGDAVLEEKALLLMDDVRGTEILLEVAGDPTHPLHASAIGSMSLGFWRPEHQRLKIAALSHGSANVRQAAAATLLMDEPVAAEPALLRCLEDPVLGVVSEAAQTLEYYPSVAVVLALAERIHRGPPASGDDLKDLEELRWQSVLDTWDALRKVIRDELVGQPAPVTAALREWLAPAWTELAYEPAELEPEPRERGEPAPTPRRRALPFEELATLLRDPNTPVSVLRQQADVDVTAYSIVERSRLFDSLASSDDRVRRELLARFCKETGDSERLVALLGDSSFLMRKSAMYHLGCLRSDPSLAPRILEHFRRPDVRGSHGSETLEAYVKHAPATDARRLLSAVTADASQDPDKRRYAIYALSEADAIEELTRSLPLLEEPPIVTWALHNALLDVAAKHRLAVSARALDTLGSVDNLHLRLALARYEDELRA